MKLIPITNVDQAAFVSSCYCSCDTQGLFQQTFSVTAETILKRLTSERQLLLIRHQRRDVGYAYANYVRRFDQYEIGVTLLSAYRGISLGKQAHISLMSRLLGDCRVTRLQALVSSKNLAERRVLESLGFQTEGAMVKAGKIDGQYHDIILYAINTQFR